MAPPLPKRASNDKWHISGYDTDRYDVQYEAVFGSRTVNVGDEIRVKNKRGTYRFARLVTLRSTDATWVDCLHNDFGWCSYYLKDIKGPAPKKRRRKT